VLSRLTRSNQSGTSIRNVAMCRASAAAYTACAASAITAEANTHTHTSHDADSTDVTSPRVAMTVVLRGNTGRRCVEVASVGNGSGRATRLVARRSRACTTWAITPYHTTDAAAGTRVEYNRCCVNGADSARDTARGPSHPAASTTRAVAVQTELTQAANRLPWHRIKVLCRVSLCTVSLYCGSGDVSCRQHTRELHAGKLAESHKLGSPITVRTAMSCGKEQRSELSRRTMARACATSRQVCG